MSFSKFVIKRLIQADDYLSKVIDKLIMKEHLGIHPKHHLTRYYRFFTKNVSTRDHVLDIGCGYGFVTNKVAQKSRYVVGIDYNRKNITSARGKYKRKNLRFILGDATKYKYKKEYDVLVLSNVLEHIKNRKLFLKKIKKLAPKMLIRVPMIDRDWMVLYKKELGLFYFSDKTHYTEYTFKSFKKEIESAGLKIQKYSIQFGEIWAVVK